MHLVWSGLLAQQQGGGEISLLPASYGGSVKLRLRASGKSQSTQIAPCHVLLRLTSRAPPLSKMPPAKLS